MTTIHKDFPICLISFFNVDFGIRYVSAFLKSKGYPTKFISFQQQTDCSSVFRAREIGHWIGLNQAALLVGLKASLA